MEISLERRQGRIQGKNQSQRRRIEKKRWSFPVL